MVFQKISNIPVALIKNSKKINRIQSVGLEMRNEDDVN